MIALALTLFVAYLLVIISDDIILTLYYSFIVHLHCCKMHHLQIWSCHLSHCPAYIFILTMSDLVWFYVCICVSTVVLTLTLVVILFYQLVIMSTIISFSLSCIYLHCCIGVSFTDLILCVSVFVFMFVCLYLHQPWLTVLLDQLVIIWVVTVFFIVLPMSSLLNWVSFADLILCASVFVVYYIIYACTYIDLGLLCCSINLVII